MTGWQKPKTFIGVILAPEKPEPCLISVHRMSNGIYAEITDNAAAANAMRSLQLLKCQTKREYTAREVAHKKMFEKPEEKENKVVEIEFQRKSSQKVEF